MLTKCLTTFGFGESSSSLLRQAMPTHYRYAEAHGYDYVVPSDRAAARFPQVWGRDASWFKVAVAESLLATYDVVLWLDADVAVLRHDTDILDEAPDRQMSMVVHCTPDGAVPNCGVWLLRKQARQFLNGLWDAPQFARSAWWWEQAAVIHQLGGDPDATPVSVPQGPLWGELPYEWNPHRHDPRGIPRAARFFHATMFDDRLTAMKEAIRASEPA